MEDCLSVARQREPADLAVATHFLMNGGLFRDGAMPVQGLAAASGVGGTVRASPVND
jgi:hypothetical protein